MGDVYVDILFRNCQLPSFLIPLFYFKIRSYLMFEIIQMIILMIFFLIFKLILEEF